MSAAGSWEKEVRALYARSIDMDVAEFERLIAVALTGERPDHPDLPAFLPFELEVVER